MTMVETVCKSTVRPDNVVWCKTHDVEARRDGDKFVCPLSGETLASVHRPSGRVVVQS
jgi:hypothetical protein